METKGGFYFDICRKLLYYLKSFRKTPVPKSYLLNPSIPNESSSSSAVKNLAPINFTSGARQSNR